MARGNGQLRLPHGKLIDGRTLFAGPVLSTEASQREDYMVQQRRSAHFGDEYHIYALDWSNQSLRFSIDGQDFGELLTGFADSDLNPSWRRGGPMAPFDRMVSFILVSYIYIEIGLQIQNFSSTLRWVFRSVASVTLSITCVLPTMKSRGLISIPRQSFSSGKVKINGYLLGPSQNC